MPDTSPFWIRGAAWLHRQCLRLAPLRFRRDFGADTHASFVRLVAEAHDTRGATAALGAALAGILDTIRAGLAERLGDAGHALTSGLWLDLTRAPRLYWRAPVIAGAITVILAISGGPVVALTVALYQGILAPLPYRDADRLVVVTHGSPNGRNYFLRGWSVGDYRRVEAFSQVGGVRPLGNQVTIDGESRPVGTYQVNAGALTMLGGPFAAGRDLRADDGDVVVVTQGFARQYFGTVEAAIGRTISLASSTPVIVGVLAYAPPLPGRNPMGADLFTPHPAADVVDIIRQGHSTQAIVIGRLRAGVSIEQAEAEVRAVAASVRTQFGGDDPDPRLESMQVAAAGQLLVPMLLLLGTVTTLFLIAATSLASLVLARAASRVGDTAVRRSLGASRWRLTRTWLVEGFMLALPGAALGIWIASGSLAIARSVLPQGMIPGLEPPPLGLTVAGAAVLLALTTALFALAPVLAGVIKASATSSTHLGNVAGLRRMRAQSLLIAGQVGVSVVLVAASLWLATGLYRTLSRPVGFEREGVVTVLFQSSRPDELWFDLLGRAAARLEARFGAANVALASNLPGMYTSGFRPFRVRADQDVILPVEQRPRLTPVAVDGDYFAVLGIPLVEGRSFLPHDRPDETIVLSRRMASQWFPEGALGQTVSFTRAERRVVVGVVEDVHAASVQEASSAPEYYTPVAPGGLKTARAIVLRADRSVRAIDAEVRTIFREIDPTATVLVETAADAIGLALAPRRVAQNAVIALALLALAMAVVNVYALSAYSVVQRSREIGIRIALGATTTDALRLVMRRGIIWIACGLAVGTATTFALARPALQAQIANLPTDEPWLLALAFAIVALAAIVASWLPARRAVHIDPAVALRTE